MLYDATGKPIPDTAPRPPSPGVHVAWEPSDRYDSDVSRALTPSRVDAIMTSANSGDIEDQARLATEVLEKNWDIFQAVQTRRLAVAGLEWEILPPEGDDSGFAARVAADVMEALSPPQCDNAAFDTFHEAMVYEMMGALLPGFSVIEMIWAEGGSRIVGFQGIEPHHFAFRDSRRPRLITRDEPDGMALPPVKFVYHRHRARSGDPARGGLIRPLAWLHCFFSIEIRDLLTCGGRYGKPVLML